jgi:hypothetical protein
VRSFGDRRGVVLFLAVQALLATAMIFAAWVASRAEHWGRAGAAVLLWQRVALVAAHAIDRLWGDWMFLGPFAVTGMLLLAALLPVRTARQSWADTLGTWIVIHVSCIAGVFVILRFAASVLLRGPVLAILFPAAIVSGGIAVVVAARIQGRLHQSGTSKLPGWSVIVVVVIWCLLFFGRIEWFLAICVPAFVLMELRFLSPKGHPEDQSGVE